LDVAWIRRQSASMRSASAGCVKFLSSCPLGTARFYASSLSKRKKKMRSAASVR
jgi:hypothetical protein